MTQWTQQRESLLATARAPLRAGLVITDASGEELDVDVGDEVPVATHQPAGSDELARLAERTAETARGARLLGVLLPPPRETLDRFSSVGRFLRVRGAAQ